jgi:hypothetical protein
MVMSPDQEVELGERVINNAAVACHFSELTLLPLFLLQDGEIMSGIGGLASEAQDAEGKHTTVVPCFCYVWYALLRTNQCLCLVYRNCGA